MHRNDEIEGALRSALMTMSLAAGILEKDGDEHGVAWNLRNEISQGTKALNSPTFLGFGIVIDPTMPDDMLELKDGDRLLARIVGIAPNVLADRREPIGEASSPKGDGRAAG